MFGLSVIRLAEIVVIAGIVLLIAYIFYRLNLFKKE